MSIQTVSLVHAATAFHWPWKCHPYINSPSRLLDQEGPERKRNKDLNLMKSATLQKEVWANLGFLHNKVCPYKFSYQIPGIFQRQLLHSNNNSHSAAIPWIVCSLHVLNQTAPTSKTMPDMAKFLLISARSNSLSPIR